MLSRTSSPCVVVHDIQASISRISQCLAPSLQKIDSIPAMNKICDQEVTTITHENTPTRSPTHTVSSRLRSSTETDPHESAPSPIMGLVHEKTSVVNTHNYLLPDSTGRMILDIPISERRPFVLENRHAAYEIQLETLEPTLETRTHLLDRLTEQFHAIYDNGYRQMATTPMLLGTWHEGQLIMELKQTHALFGLPPKEDPSPVRQPAASQCLPPAVIQRSQSHTQSTAHQI